MAKVTGIPKDCGAKWGSRENSCFFLAMYAGLIELFDPTRSLDAFDGHFKVVMESLIDMMNKAGRTSSVDLLNPTEQDIIMAVIESLQVRVVVLSTNGRRTAPDGTIAFQLTNNAFSLELGSCTSPKQVVYLLYSGDGKSQHGHYTLLSGARRSL